MTRYLLRRIGGVLVVMLLVTAVAYLVFFLLPSDPARLSCGKPCTPDRLAQVRELLGYDHSVAAQYLQYLRGIVLGRSYGSGAASLHCPAPCFGYSFITRQPVWPDLLTRLPVTLSLAIGSAVLWLLIGIPLGIQAALKPGSFRDRASTVFALIGASAPVFLVGVTLLYFLYFKLRIFPAPRYTAFTDNPLKWAQGLFLAWLTVAVGLAALYTRLTRGSMLEIQGEDFVRTARAKGLSEQRVVGRHVLRPTLTPIVTILGLDLGALIGGAIVTEVLFGLPGIAQATVKALIDLDLPMIVGVVLTSAFFVVMFNLIVDVLYAALDPRVRYS